VGVAAISVSPRLPIFVSEAYRENAHLTQIGVGIGIGVAIEKGSGSLVSWFDSDTDLDTDSDGFSCAGVKRTPSWLLSQTTLAPALSPKKGEREYWTPLKSTVLPLRFRQAIRAQFMYHKKVWCGLIRPG
jgi:hypothetical protein